MRFDGKEPGSRVAGECTGVAAFVALVWVGLGGAQLGAGLVSGVFVAGAVGAAVLTWHRRARGAREIDDWWAVGMGMAVVAVGWLLLQAPIAAPPQGLVPVVIGVLVATHVAAAAALVRQRVLSRPASWLLAATVTVIGLGTTIHVAGLAHTVWGTGAVVGCAAAGAAWLGLAWVTFSRALEDDRRRLNTLQYIADQASREERERLHELRSTLAGLVTGSALVDNPDVPYETRQRLWSSVRRELDRMDRLMSGQGAPVTDFNLDEALGRILDLQRLKGRHVELHCNGDAVRARFDALAEVVNILMDNAATHGGTDSSLVEVERRDEQTVDIRVTDFGRGIPQDQRELIFDWGRRGSDSPGQGIGLNLAQRLMTEDGGSLRLADAQGPGSSFVISLPAARRSPENAPIEEDTHVAWRRSG